jgi:patatin-like phospholipase/acyl hydrolase
MDKQYKQKSGGVRGDLMKEQIKEIQQRREKKKTNYMKLFVKLKKK